MTLKVGDHLPDGKFTVMGTDGPASKTVGEVFSGRKVALFAVPGAYTPTCTKTHLPGFVDRSEEFKTRGIDVIACTAVNDIFVLTNWAKDTGATGRIEMLADGSGDFAKAIGLDIDLSNFGLGLRSKRYAMLVDDGVVKILNVEERTPVAEQSSAANLCSMIDCLILSPRQASRPSRQV